MLLYSQVPLWTNPQSLATAILNAFSNNNFEMYFEHLKCPTLIAQNSKYHYGMPIKQPLVYFNNTLHTGRALTQI